MSPRAAPTPTLSLNEWAVLGVLADGPRHGYDIAAELAPGTPIGDAWRLSRQLVYRALDRLAATGLAEERRSEPGEGGPPRVVYGATRAGRAALRRWLEAPVDHLRDVRSGLLLKLLLHDRLGIDPATLLRAQRDAFSPVFARHATEPPSSELVALWRHHSAAAVEAFLVSLERDLG
jgi:DNA-binding PadR family transcriptional regulator